jgi:endonuclease/exonuclease/phosphatase (EEP) superfamily protein YafD
MFRRVSAAALILIVAAALLVSVWPQLFGLHRLPGFAHVVSFRAFAATAAVGLIVALALAAMVSRAFRGLATSLIVMMLVFVLATAAVLSARGFSTVTHTADLDPTVETEGSGTELTVLSWNTLGPATTPDAIAQLALESGADIVVLPETILDTATQAAVLMREGGSPMWAHTLAYDQVSPAKSTSLLTSVELGHYDFNSVGTTTAVLPTLVGTPRSGTGPRIIAVHAVAPIPGQFDVWPKDLALLAELCTGDNIIMAGDFNATIDHMTGLEAEPGKTLGDCTDAAMTAKSAALGTWPTQLPALLGAPIDHVMSTSDWEVVEAHVVQTMDLSGSDHRPIVARLAYRP